MQRTSRVMAVAVCVLTVVWVTVPAMAQARRGGARAPSGRAGAIPRRGPNVIDQIGFGRPTPTTQDDAHKDEIDVLGWSWGVARLERYVKQLESQRKPTPKGEVGLIFDSFFDVTVSAHSDEDAAAKPSSTGAHSLGAGGLPVRSSKAADPHAQRRLKQRSLELLARAVRFRPQRITPIPELQTTGVYIDFGDVAGESMSKDDSSHGVTFGDGVRGRVPTAAQYAQLHWSGRKLRAETAHLYLEANGDDVETDEHGEFWFVGLQPASASKKKKKKDKGGGDRPTETISFYYNKLHAKHLPRGKPDKATPSLHLASTKGAHVKGEKGKIEYSWDLEEGEKAPGVDPSGQLKAQSPAPPSGPGGKSRGNVELSFKVEKGEKAPGVDPAGRIKVRFPAKLAEPTLMPIPVVVLDDRTYETSPDAHMVRLAIEGNEVRVLNEVGDRLDVLAAAQIPTAHAVSDAVNAYRHIPNVRMNFRPDWSADPTR